ncbi:hypothetical protein GCM10008090_34800 [Arenicella chitinivorans]|uniref:Uncharacterized protein n=1 Tax=Arenicella chitinivorans TaxID=1329800 RepID=A0A918S2U9_9GAMM|nr:hypothetical protein [Arenicella chitinivorans]GHA22020.1 hypothetical protein GCM10008090_34800 [Arenicella chitinivorans]
MSSENGGNKLSRLRAEHVAKLKGITDQFEATMQLRNEVGSIKDSSMSKGAMRRALKSPQTPFVRRKAIETIMGDSSRANTMQEISERNLPLNQELPPPQLMHSDPRQRGPVRIGIEGDSLVFSRPKLTGDMVHFSTAAGADSIKQKDLMYPSMLDTKTSAHFGPGVYFTDRQTIRNSSNTGPMTHSSIQKAIYTKASEKNAERSAKVLEPLKRVYNEHDVNTYEIMPSRLSEMRADLFSRRRVGKKSRIGLSAEWHAGDKPRERRTVHKVETSVPSHIPLKPAMDTSQWAVSQRVRPSSKRSRSPRSKIGISHEAPARLSKK